MNNNETNKRFSFIPQAIQLTGINPWLGWIIKLVVAAGLLIFLVQTIKPADIQDTLSQANVYYLLIALCLMPFNILLQGLRWQLFVSTEVKNIPLYRCLSSLLGGFSMGLITPGRVGEIGRIFLLRVPSKFRLAGLHILDKMYTFGAVSLSGPILLFLFPGFKEALPASLRTGILIFAGILPLLYIWLAYDPRPLKSLLLGIQLAFPRKPKALEVITAFERLTIKQTSRALAITISQILLIYTQFFFVTRAFQPVSWPVAAHTYGVVLFIKSALPVSLGSLGVGEWATVSLYERYGIPDAIAFNCSMLIFAINVLIPAIIGLLIILKARTKSSIKSTSSDRSEAA